MKTLSLALRSLANRRTTALLTLCAIAVSVALLLGVQKLRTAARDGFANTVSGVDLIVGARSGQINLLLYSVFRVGDATANVSWDTYQKVARRSDVAWTIPLSLGDSHRGYRVLGTNLDYFRHYRFAGGREITLGDLGAKQGILGGINAVIVGNYLTTLGRSPDDDLQMLDDLAMPIGALSKAF